MDQKIFAVFDGHGKRRGEGGERGGSGSGEEEERKTGKKRGGNKKREMRGEKGLTVITGDQGHVIVGYLKDHLSTAFISFPSSRLHRGGLAEESV